MKKLLMFSAYVVIGATITAIANSMLGVQYTADSRGALIVSKCLYLTFGMGLGLLLRHFGWL